MKSLIRHSGESRSPETAKRLILTTKLTISSLDSGFRRNDGDGAIALGNRDFTSHRAEFVLAFGVTLQPNGRYHGFHTLVHWR